MSIYSGLSYAELKVECRRYGLLTHGKKRDLHEALLKAHVKRTRNKLHEYPAARKRPSYLLKTLPELRAEARDRRLHVSGTKDAVIKRLRDADWNVWNSRLQTFPQFAKLPVEIQEYIWEYSLPGPRVLAAAHRRSGGPNGLYFPKVDHTPNPAALSTCHLSRTLALKRYRLVFGTNNIYADLEGGDIFYIGPWSRSFGISATDLWECEHPPAAVLADLEKLTHVLLSTSVYECYRLQHRGPRGFEDREHPSLKSNLSRFKNLKKVSLACGGHDYSLQERSQGQVYVEDDIMKFKRMDAGDYWSYHPKETAIAIKSHFYEMPTEEEIMKGIPEVQLVEVHRVQDAPRRELQDANGEAHTELYVCLSMHYGLMLTNNFCSMIGLKNIGKVDAVNSRQ